MYQFIKNPKNNRQVKVTSKLGKLIIHNYLKFIQIGGASTPNTSNFPGNIIENLRLKCETPMINKRIKYLQDMVIDTSDEEVNRYRKSFNNASESIFTKFSQDEGRPTVIGKPEEKSVGQRFGNITLHFKKYLNTDEKLLGGNTGNIEYSDYDVFLAEFTIQNIRMDNFIRLYLRLDNVIVYDKDKYLLNKVKTIVPDITSEVYIKSLIKFWNDNNDIFPSKDKDWEPFGINSLNLFKNGWQILYYDCAPFIKHLDTILQQVNKELFGVDKMDRHTNESTTKNGQLWFSLCNYKTEIKYDGTNKCVGTDKENHEGPIDQLHKDKYDSKKTTEDEIKKILLDRQNVTHIDNCDQDKYHIVYKKEKEAKALFEFDKYINLTHHGFMNGYLSGKFLFKAIDPLQFIDQSEIDDTFKNAIKWKEYLNFYLAGIANIVLYASHKMELFMSQGWNSDSWKDSYGNQKAVNHLLDYWIGNNIDEEIGPVSNNLSYNIRLSKSIFFGSSSTSNKDDIRDMYILKGIENATKRLYSKKYALQLYTTHPIIKIEEDNLCLNGFPKEDVSDEMKECIRRQYMFDINDLCRKRLDIDDDNDHYPEDDDYPRSKMSIYNKNINLKPDGTKDYTKFFGYLKNKNNKYNIPCSTKSANIDSWVPDSYRWKPQPLSEAHPEQATRDKSEETVIHLLKIDALEKILFGAPDEGALVPRIAVLENIMFGSESSGDIPTRIDNLENTIGPYA